MRFSRAVTKRRATESSSSSSSSFLPSSEGDDEGTGDGGGGDVTSPRRVAKHFINIKNGIEAIPELEGLGVSYDFIRIQSTSKDE